MSLGELIRIYRKREGLTQQDLAHKCGVTQATVSRLEAGVLLGVRSDAIEVISRKLGIPKAKFTEAKIKTAASDIKTLRDHEKPHPLTSEEQFLIERFRNLTSKSRAELLDLVEEINSKDSTRREMQEQALRALRSSEKINRQEKDDSRKPE